MTAADVLGHRPSPQQLQQQAALGLKLWAFLKANGIDDVLDGAPSGLVMVFGVLMGNICPTIKDRFRDPEQRALLVVGLMEIFTMNCDLSGTVIAEAVDGPPPPPMKKPGPRGTLH